MTIQNSILKTYVDGQWVPTVVGAKGETGPVAEGSVRYDISQSLTLANKTQAQTNMGLATVASSGSYADLTNKPVLFSGSYTDLSNKPTIPAAQIQSDWTQTSNTALDYIKNKPVLFSGNYTDLTNKPVLFDGAYANLTGKPNLSVYYLATNPSGYITGITSSNVTTALGFTPYNATNPSGYISVITSSNVTTALGFTPYNATNPSGYITAAALTGYALSSSLATVATSGSYNDLLNKPTIPSLTGYATETYVNTAVSNLVASAPTTLDTLNELAAALGDDANFSTTIITALGDKADTASLANVATSGSYTDLTNKPTIPAAQIQSDWTQASDTALDYIKNKPTLFSGSYNDLTNKPTLFDGAYASLTGKPTLFSGTFADLTGKPTTLSGYGITDAQATLESGTNIKTVNGTSVLGAGDIVTPTETTASIVTKLSTATAISDVSGNVRSIPQNARTSTYVLVASDNGKHISITTGGVIVPFGVFAAGDTVMIVNNSAASQTILQSADLTLRWAGQTTAQTGNRTLGLYGIATILFISPNVAFISGAGLS